MKLVSHLPFTIKVNDQDQLIESVLVEYDSLNDKIDIHHRIYDKEFIKFINHELSVDTENPYFTSTHKLNIPAKIELNTDLDPIKDFELDPSSVVITYNKNSNNEKLIKLRSLIKFLYPKIEDLKIKSIYDELILVEDSVLIQSLKINKKLKSLNFELDRTTEDAIMQLIIILGLILKYGEDKLLNLFRESLVVPEFTIGKYKGLLISDILGSDPNYVKWLMDSRTKFLKSKNLNPFNDSVLQSIIHAINNWNSEKPN